MGLTENIKTVVATIEELATAIEEKGVTVPECASFTEYPDLIRKIEGEEVPLKSYSTVFAFTESEDTPDISVLSNVTYSPDTGADFSNAEEWSSGQFMAPRSITEPIVWESHAIFNSDGENTTGWSAPIRKTGKDGINGESIKGDKGDQGESGKDGIDGKDGISAELIYKRVSDSSIQVEAPSSYDLDKYQPEGWTLFPQGVDVNYQIEYVCQREKIDGEWGNYSNPAIWAMYGAIGKDGNGIEYIYKLSEDRPDTPIAPDTTGLLDESFPSDWSDNPLSVTEVNTICWVSTRKQSYINDIQKWGEYSVPTIWSKFGKDGTDGKDGEKGEDGSDGAPGIDGVGISEIIKKYELGNDPQNHPEFSESSTTDPSTLVTNYNTARYIWCQETTIYTNDNSTSIYYIVTVHGEPGANGTGNDAPIIYPAGVWSADKEYIAESNKVPYVFYAVDGKYYMLNSKELIIGEGEGSGWKGNQYAPGTMYEEKPIWTEMESFEAIYSDIGLFNQALVGKWVFHGDYMFSQQGKDDLDAEKWYYDYDDPASAISNGDFIPNICMNTVDGSAYFAGFTIDEDGFSYSKDGQFAHISSTGIEYSNSDANSYFKLDNNGNATFSSGSVKFNGDGSGSINNGTLEWDEAGNIIKCNLYSKETVSGADYYTPTFGPNTTHYLFVNSADNSLVAINLPDLDENVLTAMGDGVYYGTLVITNRKTNDLEVTMNLKWDDRDYPESVILKSGRSVRINYFNDFQDYYVVEGFIEQSA